MAASESRVSSKQRYKYTNYVFVLSYEHDGT